MRFLEKVLYIWFKALERHCINTCLDYKHGLLNTYLFFFDIVSSEPGPSTTVDPVWGFLPFRRTLKAVRGEVCVPS